MSRIEERVSVATDLSVCGEALAQIGRPSMPHSESPLRSIAFFFVLLTNTAAIAQDSGDGDSEYMFYADQYARCAAFFAIAADALASLGDHKTALTYQEYRYGASMYSFFFGSSR